MDYHVTVYCAYELVGIDLPNLWASFSLYQRAKYYFRQLYLPHIYPMFFIKDSINKMTVHTLEKILQEFKNKGKKKIQTSLKTISIF